MGSMKKIKTLEFNFKYTCKETKPYFGIGFFEADVAENML